MFRSLALLPFAATVLVAPAALSQQPTIIGADVIMLLSDPAGGEAWAVRETYSITYPGITSCESQIPNIQSHYVRQVADIDLITPSGHPPHVEVEVACVER